MNFITPIALILASVGIFWGYINPTYTAITGSTDLAERSITELQSDEKDYNDALSKTRQIETMRENLLTKLNAISQGDRDRILKLLPDHIDSVRLIIDINNIAVTYGMSLSDILLSAPGAPSSGGASGNANQAPSPSQAPLGGSADATQIIGPDEGLYDSVQLGFNVSGSYEDFLSFLRDLQDSLRVVDIVSLSFKTSRDLTQSPGSRIQTVSQNVYTYSVIIRTYYLK